jgi:transcription elongation factor GreA
MAEYITIEGMNKLKEKIAALTKERPLVIEQVQIARAMGDLSENAEYHAAKERQRNIDNELSFLNHRMTILKVINPLEMSKDSVRFGAIVTIKEKKSKTISIYQLVGPDEVYDRDDGVIAVSYVSPLGKAMVGKKIKEDFCVEIFDNIKKDSHGDPLKREILYTILEIK